ncbi:MAG: nuclease-related domain-containing protein [Candidatus Merdivicinus sp.]|jgi:hypothetical protein
MNTMDIWMIVGAAIAAVIIALVVVKLILAWNQRRLGIDGTRRVEKLLKRFARIRHFRVLSNVTLPLKEKSVTIDHILIGFFGVMLITVRNAKGTIYGMGRDKNWVRVVMKNEQEKRGTFTNPIPENQHCLEAMRNLLLANQVYKTSIENYIVFANKKAVLNTERGLPVLTFRDLKKLLKKSKYSADGNVDVEKLSELILSAAIH